MSNKTILRILQFAHLLVFVTAAVIIISLHVFSVDFLDFLRIPMFLRVVDGSLGNSWPKSLNVYHTILLLSFLLALINASGLFLYKMKLWRYISDISSFLGVLIVWPVALFFAFILATAGNLSIDSIKTIFTYFFVSMFIFILDLITWYFDDESLLRYRSSKRKRNIS